MSIKRYYLQRKTIDSFKNEYSFLSNFYMCSILIEGQKYKSVEHYYQSQKTRKFFIQEEIRNAEKPADAKRFGQTIKLIPEWDIVSPVTGKPYKETIMFKGVMEKFLQHENIKQKLLDTKGYYLIEGNWWHDNYWGDCKCNKCEFIIPGKNKLGLILMEVRNKLENKPFYCKLFNNYRFDGKCTEMACEFCDSYYDPDRKIWWYHPESDSYIYDTYESIRNSKEDLINVDDKIKTRVVNIKKDSCDIYCGRGSIWGNPFRIGIDGNKEECINKFRKYLYDNEKLIILLPNLKDKKLGCFCSPKDCHVDVIAEAIENI